MFKITQWFGENPQYYGQFGLPGHEGIDLVAPHGQDIFAVLGGTVYQVELNPNASNYGIHARVQHSGGIKTIYAHLAAANVVVNQQVQSGHKLGDADNTGNSSGSHLHFSEKEDGVIYTDESGQEWPNNFRDPWIHLEQVYSDWLNNNSVVGYVQASGLVLNKQQLYGRVVGTLNIRSQANSSSTLLGQVTTHTVVKITGAAMNGYYPVKTPIDIPVSGGGSSNPAIGLHLRADPNEPKSGEWSEATTVKNSSSPDAIKFLHAHPASAFRQAGTIFGANAKYIIRLFQTGWERQITPNNFYDWTQHEAANRIAILKNEYGVSPSNIWMEVHNEPNLIVESGNNWQNGSQFTTWANSTMALFRANSAFNGVKWVYPGLSPGGYIAGVRRDSTGFLNESVQVGLGQFDYIGCHAYWSNPFPMQQAIDHVAFTRNKTNKPLVLTEVSRNDRPAVVSAGQYGKEYAQFINNMKTQNNILAILFFVGSASDSYFEPETWVTENNLVKGIGTALVNNL